MSQTFRIHTIVGARPQFVKAAAISRALCGEAAIEEKIIHTGQHYDANMSDIFFEELDIPKPARFLGVGGGSHGQMTGRMMEGLETVFLEERPNAVLVYGDTNSTMGGALAAVKLNIPVIHIEAGLRSFNRRMPEEINRVVTDHVSQLLLCSTHAGVSNLAREGVVSGVHWVGDVMADATLFAISKASTNKICRDLGLIDTDFILCTLHRAENTDDPARFEAVLDYLLREAAGRLIVLPAHPRVQERLKSKAHLMPNIKLIEPVGYFDMHALIAASSLILTDSGGLQKEAYFHRREVVTLRDETEWVETITSGWNRLWTEPNYLSPRIDIDDYGQGDAAQKCVAMIMAEFGIDSRRTV